MAFTTATYITAYMKLAVAEHAGHSEQYGGEVGEGIAFQSLD